METERNDRSRLEHGSEREHDEEKNRHVMPPKPPEDEAEAETKKKEEEQEKKKAKERAEEDADDQDNEEAGEQDDVEDSTKKRQKIVARSRRMIDEFSEHDHADLSSFQLVQLIVAERIFWLGNKLENWEGDDGLDLHSVERQFDFLSMLADKLIDPDLEVAPEVDEVYRQIVDISLQPELAEGEIVDDSYSHVERPDDQLLAVLAHVIEHDDMGNDEVAENDATDGEYTHDLRGHSASIAFTVTALAAACRRSHHEHGDGVSDHAASRQGDGTSAPIMTPSPDSAHETHPETTPHMPAIVHATQPADPATTYSGDGSVSHPETFSDAAVAAAPVYAHVTRTTSHDEGHEAVPLPTTGIAPDLLGSSFGGSGFNTATTFESYSAKHESIIHLPEPRVSDKPVESWPLHELLRTAEAIPLGHGRYLRQAFEHGDIDQGGLIKIIKDWKKGRAYMPTFLRERAALAHRRAESFERLKPHVATQAADDTSPVAASYSNDRQPAGTDAPQAASVANDIQSVAPVPSVARELSSPQALPVSDIASNSDGTFRLITIAIIVVLMIAIAFFFF